MALLGAARDAKVGASCGIVVGIRRCANAAEECGHGFQSAYLLEAPGETRCHDPSAACRVQ
jgi:hypothetical protein